MAERNGHITVSLFRCGRSQWATDGRLRGSTDVPLSAEGRTALQQDLDQLGEMKATQIYFPADDESAAETAEVVANRIGGKRKAIAGLADPDLGLLEGMSTEQFSERYRTRYKRWMNDPLALSPPEGEGLAVARERIFKAVARVLRKAKSDGTVLVLHDYALGLLSCWLQDRPAADLWTVLKERPILEQYDLTAEQIDQLEQVGRPEEEAPVVEGTAA